jgi:hypothetical protein
MNGLISLAIFEIICDLLPEAVVDSRPGEPAGLGDRILDVVSGGVTVVASPVWTSLIYTDHHPAH